MELIDIVNNFLHERRAINIYKDYYGVSINKKFDFDNYEDYISEYLGFFKNQSKLKDVIAYACFGVFELKLNNEKYVVRHSHQEYYKLPNGQYRGLNLKDALIVTKRIQERENVLKIIDNFNDLFVFITECRNEKFGQLSIYDSAVRIGAFLGLEPHIVYIHTGVKVGVTILEEKGYTTEQLSNRQFAPLKLFPKEMNKLKPSAVENLCCEKKKEFKLLPKVSR